MVETGLSRPDPGTRSDHHNVRVLCIRIVTRAEISRAPDSRGMRQIEHLPLGPNGIDIDQNDFDARDAIAGEESSGASYKARTHDSDLMLCDHRNLTM
jgi:hypothetical protein